MESFGKSDLILKAKRAHERHRYVPQTTITVSTTEFENKLLNAPS